MVVHFHESCLSKQEAEELPKTPYPRSKRHKADDESESPDIVGRDWMEGTSDHSPSPQLPEDSMVSTAEEEDAPGLVVNEEDQGMMEEEEPALEWDAILDRESNAIARERIHVFLEGMAQREECQKRIGVALDECQEQLGTLLERFQIMASSVRAEQHEVLDDLEKELVSLLKSNHDRRVSMQKRLESMQKGWAFQIGNLMQRVSGTGGTSEENLAEDPPGSNLEVKEGADLEGNEDLDWESMADLHEPVRDTIQKFLEGREAVQAADEGFDAAIEEFDAALRKNFEAILQVAADFHGNQCERLEELQGDIQTTLISNHQRRLAMKNALEVSSRKAQERFASLLACVNQDGPSSGGSAEGAARGEEEHKLPDPEEEEDVAGTAMFGSEV